MTDWQHLVVVLPGIGGSVLARPGKPKDIVWGAGKGDIADLVLHQDQLSLEEAPHLEPVGLTESTRFLGFTVVPGYERLLRQLERHRKVDRHGDPDNPLPGADAVAVPYDFRRSIVEAAERLDAVLCAHLAGLTQAERAGRVIVVAHSLGGLVARVWAGMLGRWPWCRALITLGTPHRGAPKALDWLATPWRWWPVRNWAPWSLEGEPLALRRYVVPGEVARQVRLLGPSGEGRLARLRAVYTALAERKIGYAYEAPAGEAGRQLIRPPDQVLWAPRHATCLDLALVLAGGCLSAGLHPVVVILAHSDRPGSLHAAARAPGPHHRYSGRLPTSPPQSRPARPGRRCGSRGRRRPASGMW